jgi:hypothetical protein
MALKDNLVSYWKLDGNSNDSVGANNGTDTDITYGTDYGKIGQGISLNGSSSYIQMPNSIVTSGTSISISLWLKNGNASQAIDETVFSNQYDAGQHGCILARSSGGTVNEYSLFFGVGDSSGWQGFGDYKFAISTSSWEHYVFVINGKNRIIYRNGASIDDRSYAKDLSLTNADKFTISRKPNEAKRFWEGVVDEVGIWSRALTAGEVSQLYNSGNGLSYEGFGGNFGEYLGAGSGTTKLLLHLNGNSTDSSGNGHDLTNYNSTPFENGKFGQAPHFNGTNQSLRGTIDDPDTYASGYTWSFWAYNDATLSARRWIASTNESGAWGTCFAGSWESPYTNLWIKFGRGITNDYGDNTGYTIPVGEWFNVVMVAEGTSQKCYVNAKLVSSTTKSASMANNGTTFSIGSDSGGTDYLWDGSVDEFIQEGRAWSAQEVAKYYTYSKGRFHL